MLIFNINAAICGFFVWVLIHLTEYMLPSISLLESSLVTGAIVLIVGAVAEAVDLKPRLFFLPLWLWGILLSLRGVYLYAGPRYFWPLLAAGAVGLFGYVRVRAQRSRSVAVKEEVAQ